MNAPIYAVIDTNVIVSAMISDDFMAPTKRVIRSIFNDKIIPILSPEIYAEYQVVLNRPKFKFQKSDVEAMLGAILSLGVFHTAIEYEEEMPDPKDRIFYEVSLSGNSFLVTGNLKHFPHTPKVVSPSEMMEIIDSME